MFPPLQPITRTLILINVAVFLLEWVLPGLIQWCALWPLGPLFHPWQLITYAFLHEPNQLMHIVFNMFALYMFGGALELYWRERGAASFYVLYYFASVLAAAGTELLVLTQSKVVEPVIGASGGVFGVLLGFAWFFPRSKLIVLPIPVPVSAWLLVTIYGAIELWLGVTGRQDSVAHFAHLGGMLGGAIMILIWRSSNRGRTY
ncbi:MAG: rhomboid family intramembrane serine protease [Proteobacteria bacterium]|nr:rhomboid family intramembrane serine protease [Pseudomonadota bacterium]